MKDNLNLESASQFTSHFFAQTGKFEEVMERLYGALQVTTDSELARKLGLTTASVAGVRKRRQIPMGWLLATAYECKVSVDWLLFGEGPREATALGDTAAQPCDPELRMVPKVHARLSAGTGSLETSGEIRGLYAFRSEFLARKGKPSRMVLMDVHGDSMSPVIEEGDTVLIDQSQTDVIPGRIYAVGIDDEVVVKFLDKIPGHLVLRSKNPDYSPVSIDLHDESLNLRIIGRIIWWCREAR